MPKTTENLNNFFLSFIEITLEINNEAKRIMPNSQNYHSEWEAGREKLPIDL